MSEIDWRSIGARVRQARKRASMSQDALAGCIGLMRSSVANIETGRQRTPLDTLAQIATTLDVSSQWIVFGSEGVVERVCVLPAEISDDLTEMARLARTL